MDPKIQGTQLEALLGLRRPPVALAFRSEPLPNVSRIRDAAPAGCGYWKLAADGQVFFTEASDHTGCSIGAYTHGVDLQTEAARELEGMLRTMAQIEYIQVEEVPAFPRRNAAFRVAIYAPLVLAPVEPDVVLVQGNARQMMFLTEAVHAAGISQDMATRLRPTCAIVPDATDGTRASLSLGCIGNRVYTGLADDELYMAIPGPKVAAVVEKLETIIAANRELENFHRERKSAA